MMRPEAVPSEWAEKAAGEIAGAWDGEYIDIPTAREMARHALAAVLSEVQARALRDAANETDWTFGTFVAADGVMSIGMHGKSPSELLRERAARLTAKTEARCNCGYGGFHEDRNPRCDQSAPTEEATT